MRGTFGQIKEEYTRKKQERKFNMALVLLLFIKEIRTKALIWGARRKYVIRWKWVEFLIKEFEFFIEWSARLKADNSML